LTHEAHLTALIAFKDILDVLLADLAEARPETDAGDTPERRRRFIRNGIALVEGATAAMRRIALADVEAGVGNFNPGEIAILTGKIYELNDEGDVRSVPHAQKLARLVRFSCAVHARTYGAPFTLKVDGDGWRCFRETVVVRNRLTHPKTPSDLVVNDAELENADIAFGWFVNENLRLGALVRGSVDADLRTDETDS
jgi:hypothetical protein